MIEEPQEIREPSYRERCYDCFRPVLNCFCEAIPSIDNRTRVVIIQHRRERFHAFNTARIVRKALMNCQLYVDHREPPPLREIADGGQGGLLYPSVDAPLIDALPASRRPRQLVIIDGTWHQAKTMLRDMPSLRRLPCYRLSPQSPGRYRIRKEPNAYSLSTLEAAVAALQSLEPETKGLSQLLDAFETMVNAQLAHPKEQWRSNRRRGKSPLGVPLALIERLPNIVVAYGEAAPSLARAARMSQKPIYWVAQRLVSGERFAQLIAHQEPPSDAFLGHLGLDRACLRECADDVAFRAAWNSFLRPDDLLVVYHPSTERLLANIRASLCPCIALKSIDYPPLRTAGALEQRIEAAEIPVETPCAPGRAGLRLAMAKALVYRLHQHGRQIRDEAESRAPAT